MITIRIDAADRELTDIIYVRDFDSLHYLFNLLVSDLNARKLPFYSIELCGFHCPQIEFNDMGRIYLNLSFTNEYRSKLSYQDSTFIVNGE